MALMQGAQQALLIVAIIFCGYAVKAEAKELQNIADKGSNTGKITFLTDNDFPYQTDDGRGATYEILQRIFTQLNYSDDRIVFSPWARSFDTVKSGKNDVAIFSMTRKPAREDYFDWCCYLYDGLSPQIIVRKGFKPSNPEDALSGKTAVLWRGSAGILRFNKLVKNGLKADRYEVNNHKQIIQMLLSGRADFTISFFQLIEKECKAAGLDCSSMVALEYPRLKERNRLYVALSRNTDKGLRDEFVKAFLTFQGTSEYLSIVEKYGLEFSGQ